MGAEFRHEADQESDDWNDFLEPNIFLNKKYFLYFKSKLDEEGKFNLNEVINFFTNFIKPRKALSSDIKLFIASGYSIQKSKLFLKFLYKNYSNDKKTLVYCQNLKLYSKNENHYVILNSLYFGDSYSDLVYINKTGISISKIIDHKFLLNETYLDIVEKENFNDFYYFLEKLGVNPNERLCENLMQFYDNKYSIDFLRYFVLNNIQIDKFHKNDNLHSDNMIQLCTQGYTLKEPKSLYLNNLADKELMFEKHIDKNQLINNNYFDNLDEKPKEKMIKILINLGVQSQSQFISQESQPNNNMLRDIIYLYTKNKIKLSEKAKEYKFLNLLGKEVAGKDLYIGDFYYQKVHLNETLMEDLNFIDQNKFLHKIYLIQINDLLSVDNSLTIAEDKIIEFFTQAGVNPNEKILEKFTDLTKADIKCKKDSLRYIYEVFLDHHLYQKQSEKFYLLEKYLTDASVFQQPQSNLNQSNLSIDISSKNFKTSDITYNKQNQKDKTHRINLYDRKYQSNTVLYFSSMFEKSEVKIEEFIDPSFIISDDFYFPNKEKDPEGKYLFHFLSNYFKTKPSVDLFKNMKLIDGKNSVIYMYSITKLIKDSKENIDQFFVKDINIINEILFLVSKTSNNFSYLNKMYLPDKSYQNQNYTFQEHLSDSELLFLSDEYFKFDPETNRIMQLIFKSLGIGNHNEILNKINLYLNESNINYFLDIMIKDKRIIIDNMESIKSLICRINKVEFYTEKNKNGQSAKKLLKDIFIPCPFFNLEMIIIDNIFLSQKYLNTYYEEKLKLFKKCGLKTHDELYPLYNESQFMTYLNHQDLLTTIILTHRFKSIYKECHIKICNFNNNQILFLKDLFNKDPNLDSIYLLTQGKKSYHPSKDIYMNDLISNENELKIEQILNMSDEINLFLSNIYFESVGNDISRFFRNPDDYDKVKEYLNYQQESKAFFRNFLSLKMQTELLNECEGLLDEHTYVKFLKEIFFYSKSDCCRKKIAEDKTLKKKNKSYEKYFMNQENLASALTQKMIFLNKDNKSSSSNLYMCDEINEELRIEKYLENGIVLNPSYKLNQEEKLRAKDAEIVWYRFLKKLNFQSRFNWDIFEFSSFDEIRNKPFFFNYFIDQVSLNSKSKKDLLELFEDADNKSQETFKFEEISSIKVSNIHIYSFYELTLTNYEFSEIFFNSLFSKNQQSEHHLKLSPNIEFKFNGKNYSLHAENFMLWFLKSYRIIPSSINRPLSLEYLYDSNLIKVKKSESLKRMFPTLTIELSTELKRLLNLKNHFDLNSALDIMIEILTIKDKIKDSNDSEEELKEITGLFKLFYDILLQNKDEFMDLINYNLDKDTVFSINDDKVKQLKNILSIKIKNSKNKVKKKLLEEEKEIEKEIDLNDLIEFRDNSIEIVLLSSQGDLQNPENLFFIEFDFLDYSGISINDRNSILISSELKSNLRDPLIIKNFKEILRIFGVAIIDKDSITIKSDRHKDIRTNNRIYNLQQYFNEKLLIYSCYAQRYRNTKSNKLNETIISISCDDENFYQEKRILKKFNSLKEKVSSQIIIYEIEDETLQFYYENKLLFEDSFFIKKSENKVTEVFIANVANAFMLKEIKLNILNLIKDEIQDKNDDLIELEKIVNFDENLKILEYYLSKGYIDSEVFNSVVYNIKNISN